MNSSAGASSRRIAILGASLDVGNRGVRALGVALAHLVSEILPGSAIVFHYSSAVGGVRRLGSEDTDPVVSVFNCRMSPKSDPGQHIIVILGLAILHRLGVRRAASRNPWLKSLLEADVIADVRGGDSFSDIYGVKRFVIGSLPLLSVWLLNKPYILLPQTFGPFGSAVSRSLAVFMLRRAAAIASRDKESVAVVRDISGAASSLCPDVAFTLPPAHARESDVELLRIARRDGLVFGINISGLLYMGGYTRDNMFGLHADYRTLIVHVVSSLLESTGAHVILIPHVFGSEREEEASRSVAQSMHPKYSNRVSVLTAPASEREIKWLISQVDLFIGARMHACIAAISQCIPCVALAYSDKFIGVFETAGVPEMVVDLRRSSEAEVVVTVLDVFNRRKAHVDHLRSHIPRVQGTIRDELTRLLRATHHVDSE